MIDDKKRILAKVASAKKLFAKHQDDLNARATKVAKLQEKMDALKANIKVLNSTAIMPDNRREGMKLLAEARREAGVSVCEVMLKAGVTQPYCYQAERGHVPASAKLFDAYCEVIERRLTAKEEG
jgi:hypothetical protein